MPVYEVIDVPSHQPALVARVRHTAPDRPNGTLPVLFLHGSSFPSGLSFDFRMDGQSWMDWMAARGYDVYALDFPGYGLSDRYPADAAVPPGRARAVAQDVGHAVDAILHRSGQRQVMLVGHSWGGSVAAAYAQEHAAKVAKLVLFAAITPRPAPTGGAPATDAPPAPTPMRSAYEELTPAQRIAAMDGLRPKGEPPQLHAEVFSRWGAQWLASDGRSAGGVRFPSGPAADLADLRQGRSYVDPARLAMPVLLVRGEWDAWPDDADYRHMLGTLRSAREKRYVVIPRGTHVMHLEGARTQLYEAVRGFLAQLTP